MKKTVIALFSISVTAGTTYLVYSQVKDRMIKNLLNAWGDEAKKQSKILDETTLTKELDKLFAWDIRLLMNYTNKISKKETEENLKPLQDKIEKKELLKKVDLKSLEGIIFKTKKI